MTDESRLNDLDKALSDIKQMFDNILFNFESHRHLGTPGDAPVLSQADIEPDPGPVPNPADPDPNVIVNEAGLFSCVNSYMPDSVIGPGDTFDSFFLLANEEKCRTLIRYDMTSIPSGKTIATAKLKTHINYYTADVQHMIARLTQKNWTEDATWNKFSPTGSGEQQLQDCIFMSENGGVWSVIGNDNWTGITTGDTIRLENETATYTVTYSELDGNSLTLNSAYTGSQTAVPLDPPIHVYKLVTGQPWTTPGGDYTETDAVSLFPHEADTNGWLTWDITAIAQTCLADDGIMNLILKPVDETTVEAILYTNVGLERRHSPTPEARDYISIRSTYE